MKKQKIIVILGPTATGKSDLAVEIARKHKGEVISADSRQVFKGLDIGTGKITKKEMRGVPHHMLDIVSPKRRFSVAEWKELADKQITDILDRGKVPIICGGTGFYIQSIVRDMFLPEVPPNPKLRLKLEQKSASELFAILKKLDPRRAKTVESKNPVRLVRAIEIATAIGKSPEMKDVLQKSSDAKYDFLQIGLTLPPEELKKRIHGRLVKRMKAGMISEAEKLHKSGLSWKRMSQLGLEYSMMSLFLQNKISKQEMLDEIEQLSWQYARRQVTWFKRDKNIKWFEPTEKTRIETEVAKFLSTK